MDASEVLYSKPANAMNALSTEMSLTPTLHLQQQQQQPTPLSPLTTTSPPLLATTPTTPRTTTHTPREIPTMYILDQMYDDYLDQYNGNNITTPTEVPEANSSVELVPCSICSRTFNPVTLRKHVGICEKMTTKKRNIFDSSRQRREGTDLATYPLPKNFGLPEKTTSSSSIAQVRNERGQSPKPAIQQVSSPILARKKPSEDLIRSTARASMRKAVSTTSNASSTAASTTPSNNFNRDRLRSSERSLTRSRGIQPLPAEQCPHCERCFGIKAYDRHVEWCKEKALQAAIKQGCSKNEGSVAKARLEARTKYRAPCLKTKRSLNREKYSGVPGEDHETEDTSKTSKASVNKTQENSLMSMSMTSSMCSERKITNSTTGNINEPRAIKVHSNNNESVGNRKSTRDKSQTSQPPTITAETSFTAAPFAAAAVVTKKELHDYKEPIINLEMQMPEFHLLGEQMTATAINNKQRVKATKVDALTAAKIKPLKQKQQKLKQRKETEKDLEINPQKSNQKLKTTTDVQINLPSTSAALEQKKSASDLCFKSMRRDKLLTETHKVFEKVCGHKDYNKHDDNVVYDHDEVKFKANGEPNSKSLQVYVSTKNNEENLKKSNLENTEIDANVKMTIEQYFAKEEIYNLEKQNCYTTSSSFQSKEKEERNEINENDNIIFQKCSNNVEPDNITPSRALLLTEENEDLIPLKDLQESLNIVKENQDLLIKQSYPNDSDSDEFGEFANNSLINSIPKLDIPKSPRKIRAKEKTGSKSLRKSPNKTQNFKTEPRDKSKEINPNKRSLKCKPYIASTAEALNPNIREYFETKDRLSESETYKDCLTDSDELRLKNVISREMFGAQKEIENPVELLYKDSAIEKDSKIVKTSTNSDTFIRKHSEKSYKLKEFKDNKKSLSTQQYLKCSKSSEDFNCFKPKTHVNETTERTDTPRTPKSLRLPQLSTSSNQKFTSIAPTAKTEILHIKSLNICQQKRQRALRQTVSCSKSFPMKATIQALSMDNLEICGVNSAPHITTSSSTMPFGGGLEEIEYEPEKCEDTERGNEENNTCVLIEEIKVIKEPPQLKRNRSFTVSGLPDNYDPFLSAKRQLEELCSPTSDSINIPTTPQTPQLPSMPATPNSNNKMTTSLILSSSTPNTTPNLMTTSQIPQQTQKTPTLARSSSFRRTSSLRGPRRSPMLSARPPLFAQKHRPTIQRGLSDEGPISTNFLKTEEYDEMPVRSVCVNDFAVNKSPRVVRRDTSTSNRKQPLKLNINAANANSGSSASGSPNVIETEVVNNNTASKYVSKTDSLAVFLNYEHEVEKLNNAVVVDNLSKGILEAKTPPTSSSISTPQSNLDGPLNAKELKDKSNNLSKQNSAKNIKADILTANENTEIQLNTNDLEASKYGQVRLAPLATKPSTPLTKPTTPLLQQKQTATPHLTPINVKNSLIQNQEQPKSPKPVALNLIFGSDNKNTKQSSLLYSERLDYIDPKLINKCDNLPINLNLKHTDFKHSDSDTSEPRLEHFSSSSSESSAPAKKATSLAQKFLPTVNKMPQHQMEMKQMEQNHNFNINQNYVHQQLPPSSVTNSQRNSVDGRNLLKRRMRLGRNQFLYDASPEGDSCSADDEGANRSSMEGDASQHHCNSLREHENAFERLSSAQMNPIDAPFIPPLPAFDDFDFEEFLSSFENDEEQFPLFKDCREFLMNRTSKKQRSMLMPNSATQNTTNIHTNSTTNFKKSSSPQTFSPLTPQSHSNAGQHFQFPSLPQQPKNLLNSFSLNTRPRNKYDELTATKSPDTFCVNPQTEEFKELDSQNRQSLNQKREIFISIETEQNDLDKSPISPNSIRNMVGNPQTVVEVEVDAAHDNKFSKISDDDGDIEASQNMCRSKNYSGHLLTERLPNVQLNNAKNLIQKMQEGFRQMGEEMSGNLRLTMDQRTAPVDVNMNSNSTITSNARNMPKINRSAGTPSGDVYGDSDELSSLDGYPLSSPNSRLGVSSKTSADSAYGSLSRQRSSELISQRSSSRSRGMTLNPANTLINRPLTEETSLGRSRQLSASSSSSSEHALPPITSSNSYHKQQQQQQQQHLYCNNNNKNNNNVANDLDDLVRYERSNNNNYEMQPIHPNSTSNTNSHSNLESLQHYTSNSTMSTSMKVSKFCHECGSKFLLEQAKFCMDCGVKRIVL